MSTSLSYSQVSFPLRNVLCVRMTRGPWSEVYLKDAFPGRPLRERNTSCSWCDWCYTVGGGGITLVHPFFIWRCVEFNIGSVLKKKFTASVPIEGVKFPE